MHSPPDSDVDHHVKQHFTITDPISTDATTGFKSKPLVKATLDDQICKQPLRRFYHQTIYVRHISWHWKPGVVIATPKGEREPPIQLVTDTTFC